MNKTPRKKIIDLLQAAGIQYRLISHEPVFTNEQAEAITGLGLRQGAKSLLIKTDASFVLAVVPGDQRVDMQKVATAVGAAKARLANKKQIAKIMFCDMGACYPFGYIIGIPTLVDPLLQQSDIIAFNPGVNDQSVVMATNDYLRIAQPQIYSITKKSA